MARQLAAEIAIDNQDFDNRKGHAINDRRRRIKTQLELGRKYLNGLVKVRVNGHNMNEFNSRPGRPSCL